MDNYLMLDGKKYELSPELANALRSCVEPEPEKKSPFLREKGQRYWRIGTKGAVYEDNDISTNTDNLHYAVANYCTDKALMEQRAMHETLNRLLWRYSEEHGGDGEWGCRYNYYICLSKTMVLEVHYLDNYLIQGAIYFKDRKTAEDAIEQIVKPFLAAHPDFVW